MFIYKTSKNQLSLASNSSVKMFIDELDNAKNEFQGIITYISDLFLVKYLCFASEDLE